MRFFTDDAERDDAEWGRRVSAYSKHLASLTGRLPDEVMALGTDPRLDLHDGRFVRVDINRAADRVSMVLDIGSLQVGFRRMSVTFDDAEIVPDDLHLLAEAIGATFRPNHWHRGTAVTEIRWHEVDVLPDGKFVLRLRLWPFHEFSVEFGMLTYTTEPLASPPLARAGRFITRI